MAITKKDVSLSLTVTADTLNQLDDYAEENGVSRAEAMRTLMRMGLIREKRQRSQDQDFRR